MWLALYLLVLSAVVTSVSGQCSSSEYVTTSTTLQSPSYPQTAPPHYCYMYDVHYTSPPGTTMTISCPTFFAVCYRYYYYGSYYWLAWLWTSIDHQYDCGNSYSTRTTTTNSLSVYYHSYVNYYHSYYSTLTSFYFDCNIQVNGDTPNQCTCGRRSSSVVERTTRIVGGTNAFVGEFPYIVALLTSSRIFKCGGSLLSERWIITAAHCKVVVNWLAVLGQHQRSVISSNQVTARIIEVTVHPNYDSITNRNDLIVAKLDRDITYTAYIQPICLPEPFQTTTFVGEDLTASGWGSTAEGQPLSDILQMVSLDVITNSVCAAKGGLYTGRIFDTSICAETPSKDTCQGDSGGPLAHRVNGKSYLIGVTSFGEGCARNGRPGVYVRVSHPDILNWIKGKTGISCNAPRP